MGEISNICVDKARLEPELVFHHPTNLVREQGMTRGQKLATLARWRDLLLDRLRATGEGMAPPAGNTAYEAATIEDIAEAEAILLAEEIGRAHV